MKGDVNYFMKLQDYKFNIGDEVITTIGEIGKIINICDCASCKERGFNELIWVPHGAAITEYITVYDASNGFKGFHKIGDYIFNDFNKQLVLDDIKGHKDRIEDYEKGLSKLMVQLKTIEETEANERKRQEKLCIIYSPSYERAKKKLDEIVSKKHAEGIFTVQLSNLETICEDGECWKIVCITNHFEGLRWYKCLIEESNTTIWILNNCILPHADEGCRDNVEYF